MEITNTETDVIETREVVENRLASNSIDSKETTKNVLQMVGDVKIFVSSTLQDEMKRRKMNKKSMAEFIEISFPTLMKLIKTPCSQSLALIERVFKKLNETPIA